MLKDFLIKRKNKHENLKQFYDKSGCPNCKSTKGFKFHFNISQDKQSYPNECLNCGCFCNVFGEILQESKIK